MNNLFIIYRFIHKMFACIVMVTFVPVRRYAGHYSTGRHHEQETRRQNCACYGRFQWHRLGYGQALRCRGRPRLNHPAQQNGDGRWSPRERERGKLDTIFVNAGGGNFVPLGHISEDFYNTVFDTNVKGVIFTVQKALSLLKDGGTIVLNASTTASQGMPNFSVYAASKAAVRNLARGWANDLKDRKIRVNAVSPGVVVTPAYSKSGLTEEPDKRFAAQRAPKIPLGP